MCLPSRKGCFVDGQNSPFAQNRGTFSTVGAGAIGCDKILGVVLTSLLALYVGLSRLNATVCVDQSSKPLACGLFVLLAVRKLIQKGTNQVGSLVENYSQKVDDVMMRVSSNSTLTRIKSSVSASSMRLIDLATGRGESGCQVFGENRFENCLPKIAVLQSPFLSLETTSDLSLGDINCLFQYALHVNRCDFDKESFISKLNNAKCQDAIRSMDHIVFSALGCMAAQSVPPAAHGSSSDASDADALYFVAVVCIFAEWRSLRLVPPGHPRYAIGMGLARRDLIQNAQKIETAVHHYLWNQEQRRMTSGHSSLIASPTLHQLIFWEIERKIHPRLPRVREKSGASGLIWICRQLKYQNLIFQNLLQVPLVYPTSKMAVTAAYTSTYEAYHGFLVKQVFLSSFDAAPGAVEILNHMIPYVPVRGLVEACSGDRRDIDISTTASLDRPYSLIRTGTVSARNPFELLGNHFLNEWMKLERFLNQCKGSHVESSESRNGLFVPVKGCSVIDLKNIERIDISNYQNCAPEMSSKLKRAEEAMLSFNGTMEPVLSELDSFIYQRGINDPSKC